MRKLISIILIISICMITIISHASNETNTTNQLEDLQNNLNEVQNQITDNEEKIEDIDEQLSENMKQLIKIDESIRDTQNTLNDLNKQIQEIEAKIQDNQDKLDIATTEYNTKKDLLDKRLVAMYEAGDTRYLDILLSSEGISDFISNYYLISEIVEYDQNLIDEVENRKNGIESQKQELLKVQEELNTKKQAQLRTNQVLENNKAFRKNYSERLTKDEKKLQKEIEEYYKQIEQIENEIRGLAVTKSFGADYIGGTMQWPIKDHYTITSPYGMRTHPITGVYKLHTGMDIRANKNDNFTAAAYGIVTKAGYNTAYGNMVIIDHGGGVQTLYAHGTSIAVKVGDIVNPGDLVLKVGSTGYSTGPHAHFEIRINGETVNPLDYVSIPEQDKN